MLRVEERGMKRHQTLDQAHAKKQSYAGDRDHNQKIGANVSQTFQMIRYERNETEG